MPKQESSFFTCTRQVYGFTIALYEYRRTIESLWQTVRDFAKLHPEHIAKVRRAHNTLDVHQAHPLHYQDNSINFLVDDASKGLDAEYNLCHCGLECVYPRSRITSDPLYFTHSLV